MKSALAGVAKALVPQVDGGDAGERTARHGRRAWKHGIQIALGITAQNHRPRMDILDRKTRCIKFNGNRIFAG